LTQKWGNFFFVYKGGKAPKWGNSIIDDPKETANVTPTKKNAAKSYKPSDFDKVCSNQLKSILDTAK
jgi:hypothetical protein